MYTFFLSKSVSRYHFVMHYSEGFWLSKFFLPTNLKFFKSTLHFLRFHFLSFGVFVLFCFFLVFIFLLFYFSKQVILFFIISFHFILSLIPFAEYQLISQVYIYFYYFLIIEVPSRYNFYILFFNAVMPWFLNFLF